MRILVTGAVGFIGSHVSKLLLASGHEVIGLDNLNDAYDVRLKEWRLSQLQKAERFTFAYCDIRDMTSLGERWMHRGPFDAVIDLAARAGVRHSISDPWTYMSTNVTGTLNLLELCRRNGTKKFVLASSSSVYGRSDRLPYTEDELPSGPVSPYAASKIGAEAIAHSYHALYDINVTALRYFTVYGPAGRPDMSPFRFIRWITEGETVVVLGDGTQSRDYTFVSDIADGTVRALNLEGWAVVNLGSNAPIELLDFVKLLEQSLGREAKIEFHPANEADVKATWADVGRARRLLGWEPRTKLIDGLGETVAWYLENRPFASQIALGG